MESKKKQTEAFLFLGIFFLIVIFLYLTRRVVTPFFIAFGLAYLLDPLVDKLQKRKMGRTTATILLFNYCCILSLLIKSMDLFIIV